jgi:hypothetical protein
MLTQIQTTDKITFLLSKILDRKMKMTESELNSSKYFPNLICSQLL